MFDADTTYSGSDFQQVMTLSVKKVPEYPPDMLALCWHSTPAYYAFYYAGIRLASIMPA